MSDGETENKRLRKALEACWRNSQALSVETYKFHTGLIGAISRAALHHSEGKPDRHNAEHEEEGDE